MNSTEPRAPGYGVSHKSGATTLTADHMFLQDSSFEWVTSTFHNVDLVYRIPQCYIQLPLLATGKYFVSIPKQITMSEKLSYAYSVVYICYLQYMQ